MKLFSLHSQLIVDARELCDWLISHITGCMNVCIHNSLFPRIVWVAVSCDRFHCSVNLTVVDARELRDWQICHLIGRVIS